MCLLASETTEILLCYKKRRKADKRFFHLLKRHFDWEDVRSRNRPIGLVANTPSTCRSLTIRTRQSMTETGCICFRSRSEQGRIDNGKQYCMQLDSFHLMASRWKGSEMSRMNNIETMRYNVVTNIETNAQCTLQYNRRLQCLFSMLQCQSAFHSFPAILASKSRIVTASQIATISALCLRSLGVSLQLTAQLQTRLWPSG